MRDRVGDVPAARGAPGPETDETEEAPAAGDITVVTPTLPGRQDFLEEAVQSVRAQTKQAARHHIIWDYDLVGPGPLLNKMIGESKTPWFAVLPDDDLFDPDHLETLWDNREDAALVFSWGRMTNGTKQYRGPWNPYLFAQRKDAGIRGVFMAERDLWEQVGGYDTGNHNDDWNFLYRCLSLGAVFRQVSRETWTYRQHDKSLSAAIGALARGETPEHPHYLKRFL